MVDNDVLSKLISEYSAPRPEFGGESYITRRREWFDKPMENMRPLLMKERLKNLTIEEAKRIYNEVSVGGPKLYPKTFIENGIERIRASLDYLLYGSDDLATRFYNFAGNPESEYRLNGIGRAFASTTLFLIDHHANGIWNSAVDGGLKVLRLMPTWKFNDKLGDQYIAIVKILKDLQNACGFDDLSVTDEFVELIYHRKIGENIIIPPTPPAPPPEPEHKATKEEEATHLRIQYCLVKIGKMTKYDVWVASNDRNKTYRGELLGSLTLNELPQFAGPVTMRTAEFIDVIWFKRASAQPVAFFEIEHTTSMYSGLLRLNDVKTDYPIPKAYIVAPKERKKLYDNQIERRTFAHSELSEVCQFKSYEEIERLMKAHEIIDEILP